jgi:hypothetical protein
MESTQWGSQEIEDRLKERRGGGNLWGGGISKMGAGDMMQGRGEGAVISL